MDMQAEGWARVMGRVVLVLLLPALTAACTGAATEAPAESVAAPEQPEMVPAEAVDTAATDAAATTDAAAQAVWCGDLRSEIAAAMGVAPEILDAGPASWADFLNGTPYDGCDVSFEGLGSDLAVGPNSYMAPALTIRQVLEARGWTRDEAYSADAAGATVFAYRGEADLCVVNVGFAPPEGIDCPEDEPVTCGLPPAEQSYTIMVTCTATVPENDGS